LKDRLARIRLLALDVDGVLTDGKLWYGPDGELWKAFHVRDGLGIRLLHERGVEVAIVSARSSDALLRRLQDLRVRHIHVGREDKWAALQETMLALGFVASEVAFVGDDVLDLGVMREVGLAIAVADAHAKVLAAADWVTTLGGGNGAVREVADAILAERP